MKDCKVTPCIPQTRPPEPALGISEMTLGAQEPLLTFPLLVVGVPLSTHSPLPLSHLHPG